MVATDNGISKWTSKTDICKQNISQIKTANKVSYAKIMTDWHSRELNELQFTEEEVWRRYLAKSNSRRSHIKDKTVTSYSRSSQG